MKSKVDKHVARFIRNLTKEIGKSVNIKVSYVRCLNTDNPKSKENHGQVYLGDDDSFGIEISLKRNSGFFHTIESYFNTITHEIAHAVCWKKNKNHTHDREFRKVCKELRGVVKKK